MQILIQQSFKFEEKKFDGMILLEFENMIWFNLFDKVEEAKESLQGVCLKLQNLKNQKWMKSFFEKVEHFKEIYNDCIWIYKTWTN